MRLHSYAVFYCMHSGDTDLLLFLLLLLLVLLLLLAGPHFLFKVLGAQKYWEKKCWELKNVGSTKMHHNTFPQQK